MDQGQACAFVCAGILLGVVVFRCNINPYYGSAFKVALLDRWMVIISGPKMIEDIRRRPEDELSFTEAVQTLLQYKYTVGQKIQEDPYHIVVVKEKLQNRLLPIMTLGLIDEVVPTVQKYFPTTEDQWTDFNVVAASLKIIARVSNRAFVGLPLCRNEEYNDISVHFSVEIVKAGTTLFLFPDVLKPLVAPFISKVRQTTKRALQHLGPIIQDRRMAIQELGIEWPDKPNDVLQWIIDKAVEKHETDVEIVERLLLLNLAAIHTSSSSIAHVLYHLAEQPELLSPLREEIEASIDADGWTMSAFGRMWKLDSLLRESQRYNGFTLASMIRVAMRDIVLTNGTFIPKGTLLGAAAHPTHHDNTHFPDAHVFDPFRFARMREAGSFEGHLARLQFASTSPEYLPFGHGQLACPGRHFAANQLKAVLSYIILNHDLRLTDSKNDGSQPQRPPNVYVSLAVIPPIDGIIQLRKRAVA
ncbi:cytochrome P450 [Dichomitus squalens LYAD-421 SS1]|uniref:Cytochrome P450 n=1 Tax=Dichomitus squalens (strain LYAD-421) TaxID=732165 RepID=R7SWT2_DICSQ|nr:cytochrome P450 [Dichomitus squalens LYAD-421 SS1]EJF60423.1 cytochrome P450 [Dichomitus squalens LYAD-421 SS1]